MQLLTGIERRTLALLLRDNLKNTSLSMDCCTSRTLKSYEKKVRMGRLKNSVLEAAVNASNEESRVMMREL